MADRVRLVGLRFQACHGALPHEREVPQGFEVDVEMTCDLSRAGASDRLEDTVSYGAVAEVVRQVMEAAPVALLERLATLVAQNVLGLSGVLSVSVRVRKMAPPLAVGGGYAEVEVVRDG